MGGGGGGYDRPSSNSGSGEDSSDSDEDGSSKVPPPEPDPEEETTGDQSGESNGTNDEADPEGPLATGGGGGSGAPVAGPGEGADGIPEKDDSESEEEETDSKEDEQERGQEDCEVEHEEERYDENAEDDDNDQKEDEEDDKDDEEDECLIAESTLLHSPNPEPLGDATEGDICSVRLREKGVCVVDSQGRTIGAIAEPWVSTLKECIERGRQYRARILDIDGGKCEVRVTNKCLIHLEINLTAINTAVRDQLHPELSLSVETMTEEVVVVTADGSRVGDVPDPWGQLLKECIDQGRAYQAEVRDVTPEYCEVKIQSDTSDE